MKYTDSPTHHLFLDKTPPEISTVIREYVTGNKEEAILKRTPLVDEKGEIHPFPAWNATLCFFESVDLRADALKKALGHELISGNIPDAELLLKENVWLFDEIVEGVDHFGRKLKEKPIAFVARLYDFNPREPKENKEDGDFGAVERLRKIAIESGRLSSKKIACQIDAVLPCHWDTMTDERMLEYGLDPKARDLLRNQHTFPWQAITAKHMQKYQDACEMLVEAIAGIEIPPRMTWDQTLALPAVMAVAKKFQTDIQCDGNKPTAGLVFDPAIFPWFIGKFWEGPSAWKGSLGGPWTRKSDLLIALGYGGLQRHDTACGLQVHWAGIHSVALAQEGRMPDRKVNYSARSSNFLSFVGVSGFLDIDGKWGGGGRGESGDVPGVSVPEPWHNLISNKNSSLVTMCDMQQNPKFTLKGGSDA